MHIARLTDAQFDRIRPQLPAGWRPVGMKGVDSDDRSFIDAALWKFQSERPWSALPVEFGLWSNVNRRFSRWARDGVWARIAKVFGSHAGADAPVGFGLLAARADAIRVLYRGKTGDYATIDYKARARTLELTRKVAVEVGARIEAQRRARGVSASALARHLGVMYQQVRRFEQGVKLPTTLEVMLIAEALDCDPGVLLALPQDGEGHVIPLRKRSRKGFASMSAEQRLEISRMGGHAVPAEKRAFSQDRDLAVRAGAVGGVISRRGAAQD